MIQEIIVFLIVAICAIIAIKKGIKAFRSSGQCNCSCDSCPHCKGKDK